MRASGLSPNGRRWVLPRSRPRWNRPHDKSTKRSAPCSPRSAITANIRNPNTRAAYAVAVRGFFHWLEKHGAADLAGIHTHHVSTYVEVLAQTHKAPTVKQHLAAIRMLFDSLIVGQVAGT
jgi:hypothetical protein